MAASPATKRERLEARETDILDAAHQVFLEHGYHGAKMSLIAKRSGVAEGTLYLYYKNKNAMVAEVLARHWQGLRAGASAAIGTVDGSVEKLEKFSNFHIEKLISEWGVVALGYVQYFADDPAFENTVEFLRDYATLLDGILKQGIDRGVFKPDLDILFYRDLFFGTQEYAARSLMLRGEGADSVGIVANMMNVLKSAALSGTAPVSETSTARLTEITNRLAQITEKLESLPS